MSLNPTNVFFDHQKSPFNFDILPLQNIFQRTDLTHDPTQLHKVDFYILLIITSGEGKHTIDFKEYPYTKGSVLTVRMDQIHHFHKSKAKGYLLIFTEEYLLSYIEEYSAKKIASLFNELLFDQHTSLSEDELSITMGLVNHLLEEFERETDEHTPGIIRNYLQVIVSKIYRVRNRQASVRFEHKYSDLLLNFQSLVEDNWSKNKSVQYYADQLNVTTRTLNNMTHVLLGKSAKKVIDSIVILRIKRLLINTPQSIKEIAYLSGFDETTNFFKYFRRYTDLTPEAFRAIHVKS